MRAFVPSCRTRDSISNTIHLCHKAVW
jgi:hypothetical protein